MKPGRGQSSIMSHNSFLFVNLWTHLTPLLFSYLIQFIHSLHSLCVFWHDSHTLLFIKIMEYWITRVYSVVWWLSFDWIQFNSIELSLLQSANHRPPITIDLSIDGGVDSIRDGIFKPHPGSLLRWATVPHGLYDYWCDIYSRFFCCH